MQKKLVIVFGNQDEPSTKAFTSVFLIDKTQVEFFDFLSSQKQKCGLSIAEMFKIFNVSLSVAICYFPKHITPAEDWDNAPLKWQRLPDDQEGLQKLADLLKISVISFYYSDAEGACSFSKGLQVDPR